MRAFIPSFSKAETGFEYSGAQVLRCQGLRDRRLNLSRPGRWCETLHAGVQRRQRLVAVELGQEVMGRLWVGGRAAVTGSPLPPLGASGEEVLMTRHFIE